MRDANEQLLATFFKERRVGEKTKESYTQSLTNWDKITNTDLEKADGDTVRLWYESFTTAKPGTILTYRSKLRALHLHIVAKAMTRREAENAVNDVWDIVPVADLSRDMKLHRGDRDKLVSAEDVDRLIKSAKNPRVQALISMLIETGARKGELRSLRVKDVSF